MATMTCMTAAIKCVLVAAAALHPHHHHQPHWVTVKPGDTLAGVSKRAYGHASRWPALWWVNRNRVRNPDALAAGDHLKLARWHPVRHWLARAALAAAAPPPRPSAASSGGYTPPAGTGTSSSPNASQAVSAPSQAPADSVRGGFRSCVIQRESGGNPNASNGTHYGLYQFDYNAWVQGGGNPADYGHAPVAEQNRVFAGLYAQRGTSPWSPSDGC